MLKVLAQISLICITSLSSAHAQIGADTKEKLLNGTLRLESSFFNKAYTSHGEIEQLIRNKKWLDVVSIIIEKNWPADVYYYLLGRAAQSEGAYDAARIYYKIATKRISVPTLHECDAYLFGDGCFGMKLREEVFVHENLLIPGSEWIKTQEEFLSRKDNLPSPLTAPNGVGWIKLGMKKDDLVPGKEISGVKLGTSWKFYLRHRLRESRPQLIGISLPFWKPESQLWLSESQAELEFYNDYLISIKIPLGDQNVGEMRLQDLIKIISSNYGEPKTVGDMLEVECAYRNGARFKIKKGSMRREWQLQLDGGIHIATELVTSNKFSECPEKVTGNFDDILSHTLNISVKPSKQPAASQGSKNLF